MKFTEDEIKQIEKEFEELAKSYSTQRGQEGLDEIQKAYRFAYDAHYPIRRKSGEPYILHPISVALICSREFNLGKKSLITALLHDVVEDTDVTKEDIVREFGQEVADMVENLTKISKVSADINIKENSSLQIENFKKILISMSEDYRVVLIKLADRLHNLRTLDSLARFKQLKIASETLYVYAPLAERLGLYRIKTELEDSSFRILFPEEYQSIAKKLEDTEERRTMMINKFGLPIQARLTEEKYDYEVDGRPKSIYSIYKKMQKKDVPFEEIFDIYAFRIIFTPKPDGGSEKEQCMKIYSYVTDCYPPRPDRFRDWINNPKDNGYEALHSTVMGHDGKWVEVQIRSKRMNDIAENGIAAHHRYKGLYSGEKQFENWFSIVRDVINNSKDSDFIPALLKSGDITIFTPKGESFVLPKGSSALDFAYHLDKKIGNHAISAKINHQVRPLEYKLRNGDQVEIITSQVAKPKIDWLNKVYTAKAIIEIKKFLYEEAERVASTEKKKLENMLAQLQIKLTDRIIEKLKIFYNLHLSDPENFVYLKLEEEPQTVDSLKQILKQFTPERKINIFRFNRSKDISKKEDSSEKHYERATCCNPLPGDDIVGYELSPGNIIIHQVMCPISIELNSKHGDKIVPVSFENEEHKATLTELSFEGIDRIGIVRDLTNVLSTDLNIYIREINFKSFDGIFEGSIKLYVKSVSDLDATIQKLKKVQGVSKITRI
ncbi:MAG TPA: RelA/SpoT family protein [Salinivirgaceae bacterium]|nr:RelA/SpoT family protein [Salinivirgaceae bacterium]